MAESGFPELIKRLDAVIGPPVVTLPQPEEPRSLREQIPRDISNLIFHEVML